jgi:hypothetical protein
MYRDWIAGFVLCILISYSIPDSSNLRASPRNIIASGIGRTVVLLRRS